MAGMLLNNTLYYFDVCRELCYVLDFIIGNSIIATILLYTCSHIFSFCVWHRLIITANIINIGIASIDSIIGIPIADTKLLVIYYVVSAIFIIVATMNHIIQKK